MIITRKCIAVNPFMFFVLSPDKNLQQNHASVHLHYVHG